ncbi:potassium channel family protein [Plantactinospora siamensis]|uniref:Potassium channel family protein n=1 Tax=Plantactinospora siamensis TaxID=555372 RepID=A0ABV6P1H5_9ACTN
MNSRSPAGWRRRAAAETRPGPAAGETRPGLAAGETGRGRSAGGRRRGRARWDIPTDSTLYPSTTIFLILRRLRAPLVSLIVIFAISVLGLTLIPGRTETGQPWRMGLFDAFYFMSYTASTIGFGEIPHAFSTAQRLWVTVTIYLTVVGWAYAIGSLLNLLQDRGFRQALGVQQVTRTVARLREPFLLIAGYGRAGRTLGRALDDLGRRFVVVDMAAQHIDGLDLESYHADVPGLAGDVRDPWHLRVAGLQHPRCEGVLALTDDDEANLAVTMAAALLRPELPVVARTVSRAIGRRMLAFGSPTVVNPFDRFGDRLRLALRAPAAHQLRSWLEAGPGAELPPRGSPPDAGRWVVCGYGRFGRELTADLRAEGWEVTVIDTARHEEDSTLVGDASDPDVLARARLTEAVGFVAATDNDTTNLSALAAARDIAPDLFVVARQNSSANAALFSAMQIDALLVPSEVVAQEVYARLSTPLLWQFLSQLPDRGDPWAAALIERLAERCGHRLPALWKVAVDAGETPAVVHRLAGGQVRLGDLLRSPADRDHRLHAVVLMAQRGGEAMLTPDDDLTLAEGDQLLLVGRPEARRALQTTLTVDAVTEYVVSGRRVPDSWLWRRLTGHRAPPPS